MTLDEAINLLWSLDRGDLVRVTHQNRVDEVKVTRTAHHSDGPHGDRDSVVATVSYGPGRYSFDIAALALAEPRRPGLVLSPQSIEVVERVNSVNEREAA
ncbi:hypothetical protein ACIRF8_15080 [Streptomyces sp. NPDC102406]|uniref:hypothetical protein n=1 Tax=Streptomyces sp. NPDC102406 TaxID=3366171 RepID=UPI0038066D01